MHGGKSKAEMNLVLTLIIRMKGPCINKGQRKVTDLFGVDWFPNPKKHLELSLVVVVLAKQHSRLTGIRTETQTVFFMELCPLCVILVVVKVGQRGRTS